MSASTITIPTIPLTPAEVDLLRELGAGGCHKSAARRLNRSYETVKDISTHARLKLAAKTSTQAVAIAIRLGIIQ